MRTELAKGGSKAESQQNSFVISSSQTTSIAAGSGVGRPARDPAHITDNKLMPIHTIVFIIRNGVVYDFKRLKP